MTSWYRQTVKVIKLRLYSQEQVHIHFNVKLLTENDFELNLDPLLKVAVLNIEDPLEVHNETESTLVLF